MYLLLSKVKIQKKKKNKEASTREVVLFLLGKLIYTNNINIIVS